MFTSILLGILLVFGFNGVTVSASTLQSIEVETQQKQAEVNKLNNEIGQTLAEVNAINSRLDELTLEVNEKEQEITKTEAEIEAQQVVVDERVDQAKERLLSIQTTELNQNIVVAILEAENISDLIHRTYVMMTLQEAANEQLEIAYEEQEKLDKLKTSLSDEKSQLVEKTETIHNEKKAMDEKVTSLQAMIRNQQAELATLDQKRKTEEARIAAEKAKSEPAKVVVASAKSENTSTPASKNNSSSNKTAPKSTPATSGKKITVSATGYSTKQPGLSTHTAMGIDLRKNPMVIAVDPSVIPLGTMVKIPGYGIAIAGDTGGAIKGNKIDIHYKTVGEALRWGRRNVTIEILN